MRYLIRLFGVLAALSGSLAGCGSSSTFNKAEPIKLDSIAMLSPSDEFDRRMGDSQALADYVKAVMAKANYFWTVMPAGTPQSAEIFLAFKPGRRSRAWCEFADPSVSRPAITDLERVLGDVAPPDVKSGVLAIRLSVGVLGGKATTASSGENMNLPPDWKRELQKHPQGLPIEQVIELAWPG